MALFSTFLLSNINCLYFVTIDFQTWSHACNNIPQQGYIAPWDKNILRLINKTVESEAQKEIRTSSVDVTCLFFSDRNKTRLALETHSTKC